MIQTNFTYFLKFVMHGRTIKGHYTVDGKVRFTALCIMHKHMILFGHSILPKPITRP